MTVDRLKRSASVFVAILAIMWMPLLRAGEKDTSPLQRIQELEKTIVVLRADNAALREQLAKLADEKSKSTAIVPHRSEIPPPNEVQASRPDSAMAYWMSGTGKRHNKNCRYFGTGKGHACGPSEGVACKICGG